MLFLFPAAPVSCALIMDLTSKKLVQLLDSSDLDLRMSAIRIAAEIHLNSKEVIHSLSRCLREEPEPLRILALKALARLGARDVLGLVVPMVLEPGALREQALAVVTALGHPAVVQLCELYSKADFHGKLAVATALARIGGRQSMEFLLEILPVESSEVQKHITRCVCDCLEAMPPAAQLPFFKLVTRHLPRKKSPAEAPMVAARLLILGYFHGEKMARPARALLLEFAGKEYPGDIRRHALVSFQRLVGEVPPGSEQIAALEKLLCDDDWNNVAQHALGALKKVDLTRPQILRLVDLLRESPHFSVHIHVFEKLRGIDSREVIRAIIPFLSDHRFRVREAAESALRSLPSAVEDLFKSLLEIEDSEVCQRISQILKEYPQEVKRRFVGEATRLFINLFDQGDTRHPFFFEFTQAIDPEPLRQRIYQKVRSLKTGRSKEKWIKIAGYLQILWDHHLITPDGRYLFAVALIRESSKDLSPPARRSNLGLRVLRSLIYDDTPGLAQALTRDKDVGPEELFYIGFHFMEEGEEMRPFANALLEHLIRKYPKSRFAAAGRAKLDLHVATEPPAGASKTSSKSSKGKAGGSKAPKAPSAAKGSPLAAGKPAPVATGGQSPPKGAPTKAVTAKPPQPTTASAVPKAPKPDAKAPVAKAPVAKAPVAKAPVLLLPGIVPPRDKNRSAALLRRPSGAEEREAACRGRCGGGSASPAKRSSARRSTSVGLRAHARAVKPPAKGPAKPPPKKKKPGHKK